MIGRRNIIQAVPGLIAFNKAECLETSAKLGRLSPFYRATQLQGHLIGSELLDIPDYVLGPNIDLRYCKNPALKQEIPFADSFTINRFLGGYRADWLKKYGEWDASLGLRSLDYVVRGDDGALEYRSDLIWRRLAPYLAAGYQPRNITITLANVPWDVAQHPQQGIWGQDKPPEDMAEWEHVITHFAKDLRVLIGHQADNIVFETGVEYDEKVSFDGSAEDFFNYYAATWRGLYSVLPRASLTPGEFTGLGECVAGARQCVYDTKSFVEFAKRNDFSLAYVPRSLNSIFTSRDPYPSAAIRRAIISYQRLPETVAEIHQFGLLGQPFGIDYGSDPAAMQASWQFQTLMSLWQHIRPRRVFHWGGFSQAGELLFLNGAGFLRLILDHYLGFDATMFRIEEGCANNSYPRDEIMAIGLSNPFSSAVVVSSFSATPTQIERNIRISLPADFPRNSHNLRGMLRYRGSDNVFSLIRSHLVNANNLKPEFANSPLSLADPITMAINQSRAHLMLRRNWFQYVDIMRRDLVWKAVSSQTFIDSQSNLQTTLEANELQVINVE